MTGTVWLVGAGPGDPDLLTRKAARLLATADVVVADRLVGRGLLDEVRPDAVVVDVGKTPGHHRLDQALINALIVDQALAGRSVVRLKGGDPLVFGRGGEEALACRAAGVPVEVVPGVSSAISAPGAAGIPVTHRGVASSVTVISGHDVPPDDQLAALVRLRGTIVVLMGVATLPELVEALRRNGLAADTPVAVVERAWTPSQRTTISSAACIRSALRRSAVRAPATIVIGAVVGLAVDEVPHLLAAAAAVHRE